MDELEIFRLSAEACGYEVIYPDDGQLPFCVESRRGAGIWDPFTNDSQRWECVRKLLGDKDCCIDMDNGTEKWGIHSVSPNKEEGVYFKFECPVNEFPARALAELQRREKA